MTTQPEPPDGWHSCRLGHLLTLKYGKSMPESDRSGSGFTVFGSNGKVGEHASALVAGESLIVGRKGSVGEVHHAEGPAWPIDTTYYVDELHGMPFRYWYWFLKHLNLGDLNRATAIPGLNREDAYRLVVNLPPLNEQKRIADKLDALLARVDTCRDRLDRVPAILKSFRTAVLAAATSGQLTEDWRALHGETKNAWEDMSIGDLIEGIDAGLNVQCDERPPADGERGLVKISAVTWGRYDEAKSKTLPPSTTVDERARIAVGDLLISRANTLELVGACVIVEKVTLPLYLSDKVLRLRAPEALKPWLLCALRSPQGRQQIEQMASGNQLSMRNLSQSSLKSIRIAMPPEAERREAIRRVEALIALSDSIEARQAAATAKVERLTPALLAKAFRGELVAQDPNDEPANALLERLRASPKPAKRSPRPA